MFFFFKQKTAYEMRISDWSSDVCSSDLPRVDPGLARGGEGVLARIGEQFLDRLPERLGRGQRILVGGMGNVGLGREDRLLVGRGCAGRRRRQRHPVDRRGQDRKCVVEGKNVSIRLDLGGCSLITKKNKK